MMNYNTTHYAQCVTNNDFISLNRTIHYHTTQAIRACCSRLCISQGTLAPPPAREAFSSPGLTVTSTRPSRPSRAGRSGSSPSASRFRTCRRRRPTGAICSACPSFRSRRQRARRGGCRARRLATARNRYVRYVLNICVSYLEEVYTLPLEGILLCDLQAVADSTCVRQEEV